MRLALLLLATVGASPLVSLNFIADGLVEFEVKNPGSESLRFPTWYSPFDEMMPLANLQFHPADHTEYMGLVAKRVPESEPVLVIEAYSSIKKTFRPQSQWDIKSNVSYTLSWPGRGEFGPARTLFTVSAGANVIWPVRNATVEDSGLGYTMKCGQSTDAKYINTKKAITEATAANQQAAKCLGSNSCGTTYTTWYGAASSSRLTSITNKHNKINTAFAGSWIAYCDGSECSPNVYAYVYPSDSARNMYLCSLFYNNKDLKELVNTPVHEMSHFSTVAATKDITYGEANCKKLATNNPDQAITNADNLGYFSYYNYKL